MSRSASARTVTSGVAAALALGLGAGACSSAGVSSEPDARASGAEGASALDAGVADPADAGTSPTPAAVPQAVIRANLPDAGPARVSTRLRVSVEDGTLDDVVVRTAGVRGPDSRLPGVVRRGGTVWRAETRLESGTSYVLQARATDDQGQVTTQRRRFAADDLSLDEQTYAAITPTDGRTVGVGMPVVVTFDIPVQRKKAFEKRMTVTSSSGQKGAWRWLSDHEAHWRPRSYWKAGTTVDVAVDVNSVPAGNGIFGQMDRSSSFTVGDRRVMKVDLSTNQLTYVVNGAVAARLPFSGGKPGFDTRSGTKVVMEKFRSKRMDAATTGVAQDDPEYYDIEDVEYAMRLTYSGEFIHAAPWSVDSQGRANVSHGCTGLSTKDAGYLYDRTIIGDVVETTGSSRQMTLTNGYGDWNVDYAEWKQGSALAG